MTASELEFLTIDQVCELDRRCAEVARTGYGFGSVTIHIEHGHTKYFEQSTKQAAMPPTGHDPPRGGREMK